MALVKAGRHKSFNMAKNLSSKNGLIILDEGSPIPLYRQLGACLRHVVGSGQLKAETRLQSSRDLARELNISSNTVLNRVAQEHMRGEPSDANQH